MHRTFLCFHLYNKSSINFFGNLILKRFFKFVYKNEVRKIKILKKEKKKYTKTKGKNYIRHNAKTTLLAAILTVLLKSNAKG